jgi:hypothetical protein
VEKSTAAPRGSDSDHPTEHDIALVGHGSERRMKSVCCLQCRLSWLQLLSLRIAIKVDVKEE